MVTLRTMPVVAFLPLIVSAARMAAQPPQPVPSFTEFSRRVDQYLKLHQAAPKLRSTKRRKEIVERRQALAKKIREERPNAKQGDIFSPEIGADFRRVIQSVFQGPRAPNVRKTIRHGEPVQPWHLSVNGEYPEHLPFTTIPPTLLLLLPQLPVGVSYRIIGHDFVLQDMEARLIVDFIPAAVP